MPSTPSRPGVVRLPDSIDTIFEQFTNEGLTDGLPIIPPTTERVARFVEASGRDRAEVMAVVPPLLGEATIEKIAVNAVMAGCKAEYMPVVIAAVEAVCEPQFNLNGIQGTTSPVAPLMVINGAIRSGINVNCGIGCLGPGWRANATLGRALRLVLLNIGGGKPGEGDLASHGQPGKYTFCFGENEEASPWEPLSVERGFARGESTVTVFGAQGTSNIMMGDSAPEDVAKVLAHGMINVGCSNFMLAGEPMLVMSPTYVNAVIEAGFKTKQAFKEYIWEKARAPIDWFSGTNKVIGLDLGRRLGIVKGDRVLITDRPENIMLVVAGDPGGYHGVFIPSFGDTVAVTRAISGGGARA